MARRIKLRSKNIKKPFDKVTSEGMLIRGAIYLPELTPSFNYKNKLNSIPEEQKKMLIEKLFTIQNDIIKKHHIKPPGDGR